MNSSDRQFEIAYCGTCGERLPETEDGTPHGWAQNGVTGVFCSKVCLERATATR